MIMYNFETGQRKARNMSDAALAFGVKDLQEVIAIQKAHILHQLNECKEEMGDDGKDIEIDQEKSVEIVDDKVSLGEISFPSQAIADRFMILFKSKLQ